MLATWELQQLVHAYMKITVYCSHVCSLVFRADIAYAYMHVGKCQGGVLHECF